MSLAKIVGFVSTALLLAGMAQAQYTSSSASPAAAQNALRRLGVERVWQTQIEFDSSRGRLAGITQHISSTSAQTIYEVTYPGGRKTFSDRDLDAFSKPLGPQGAKKEAEYWVSTWKARSRSKEEPKITEHVVPDVILVATSERGTVQCINGETGRTLWSTKVGSVRHPTLAAGINEKYVTVINGTTLSLLDRQDGDVIWERRTTHPPGAGPAMSDNLIFVPMIDGHMEIYNIEEPKRPAGLIHCMGRCLVTPVVFQDAVAWPTDKGDLYVGNSEVPGVRFRTTAGGKLITGTSINSAVSVSLHAEAKKYEEWFRDGRPTGRILPSGKEEMEKISLDELRQRLASLRKNTSSVESTTIRSAPTFSAGIGDRAPLVFFASGDGYVYAVDTLKGSIVNRFSSGETISQSPVVVGNQVYVVTDEGTLFCAQPRPIQPDLAIRARNAEEENEERWFVPGVKNLLSANLERVYCLDRNRRLMGIDAKTGSVLGVVDVGLIDYTFLNTQSDRIYVGTSTGTLQCLRESRQHFPFVHGGLEPKRNLPDVIQGDGDDEKMPAEEKPAVEEEDPFGDKPAKPVKPAKPEVEDDPFK